MINESRVYEYLASEGVKERASMISSEIIGVKVFWVILDNGSEDTVYLLWEKDGKITDRWLGRSTYTRHLYIHHHDIIEDELVVWMNDYSQARVPLSMFD